MNGKLGNPAPLGLACLALSLWLWSMVNAGWFDAGSMGLVLAVAFAFGGTAQMLAGVLAFARGDSLGTLAFTSYGAFWWSFALFVYFLGSGVPGAFVGWYLLLWGVITFYLWIASLRSATAVMLVYLALWVTFVLLALGEWGVAGLRTLGGYTGLATAAIAFYASAAEVVGEAFGRGGPREGAGGGGRREAGGGQEPRR